MSTWSTILLSILSAGTYSNYGSTPTIIVLYSGSIRATGTYILLQDDDENVIQDNKGKVLMKHKSGTITIISGKLAARDNIEQDVHAILQASNYSYTVEGERPSIPQQNIFKYELDITVLD